MAAHEGALPNPDTSTIGQHLRRCHGWDIEHAIAEHPQVLLGQHERVHEQFETHKINHTHEDW